MTVKTITVTEDAYEALKRMKAENESFSKVILRVTKSKESVEKYFGALDKTDARRLERKVKAFRKKVDSDYEARKHAVSRHLSAH